MNEWLEALKAVVSLLFDARIIIPALFVGVIMGVFTYLKLGAKAKKPLPTLDNVFIEFRCPKCLEESTMTVSDLMNAGIEGPPYCDCTKDNVFLGVADTYIDRKD